MSEARHQSPEAVEVFNLIAAGRLPPANVVCAVTDQPAWRIEAVASIIGISRDELIDHLRAAPPRFAVDPGKPGLREHRLLAK